MDKGSLSNATSAAVWATGLCLPVGPAKEVFLSVGLFAFSGGITNALAVKMLFDRIPGLVGSGVIPARFREIREKIKSLILEHFFSDAYLRKYFATRTRSVDWKKYMKTRTSSGAEGRGPLGSYVDAQWQKLASPEVIQPIVDGEIEKLMDSSLGGLLLMVGADNVKPAVHRFVNSFLASLRPRVIEIASQADAETVPLELDEEAIVRDLRSAVDDLLGKKLIELDAMTVKRMMEDVMRSHLGWLVVWGNVLGAALGVIPLLFKWMYP
jgi:uncharacterized membrane protein YheB (UPF0754 family)